MNIRALSATATPEERPNLTAALELAAVGMPIFPAGPDKRPLLTGWQEKASTEEEQIRKWWHTHPAALPAIVVGRAGLVVIDCDRHPGGNDGIEAFNRLLSANGGSLAAVPMTKTANGGAHLFFKQPEGEPLGNGRGELPDGILPKDVWGFDPEKGRPKEWPLRFSIARWTATLTGLKPGAYEFRARTVDLNGYAQPEPRPYPKSGLNGIQYKPIMVMA